MSASRGGPAVTLLAGLVGASLAAGIAGGPLLGCSPAPAPAPLTEDTPLADIAVVAAGEETAFTDLPGVEGFESLAPNQKVAVLARANRAHCDCGCPGHSVNACLHQGELCDVALGMARSFVADAEALALHAGDAGPSGASLPAAAGDSGPLPGPSAAPAPLEASAPASPASNGTDVPVDPVGPADPTSTSGR